MPEILDATPAAKKDLSVNTKFAITIGAQLFVGLLGIATTAAVTILLAKSDVKIIDAGE